MRLSITQIVIAMSLAAACGGEDPSSLRTGEITEPSPPGECGDPASLPEIAGNEGPFARCASDDDCQEFHFCYQQEGKPGFCQVGDADIWCDGEGDVNLQTVPPIEDWGPGVCVYTEWRDWLCCMYPDRYDCE